MDHEFTSTQLAKWKKQFDEDGVVVLREFLNQEEVNELKCYAGPHVDRALHTNKGPGVLKDVGRRDSWFANQMTNGKHANLVRYLIGEEVEPIVAGVSVKAPSKDRHTIGPHRDGGGIPPEGKRGATVWIALDETTAENGNVQYWPGSHKSYIEEEIDNAPNPIQPDLMPGDTVIHSSNTLHWSNRNTSDDIRSGVIYFYWAESDKDLPFPKARKSGKSDPSEKIRASA